MTKPRPASSTAGSALVSTVTAKKVREKREKDQIQYSVAQKSVGDQQLHQKFKKEFQTTITIMNLTKDSFIDFDEYKTLLHKLGFIDMTRKSDMQDKDTVDLWNLATYIYNTQMKVSSLYNFLCCLLKIDNITDQTYINLKKEIDVGATIQSNTYGYVIDNDFYLKFDVTKQEQKKL